MNTINIAFCIDKKYISQLCVSIKSIILSNANEFISFFIISDNLSEDDQQFIQKAVKEQNIKISFICINSNTFKDFPTLRHISIAMYFRLLLPLILPQDINKIFTFAVFSEHARAYTNRTSILSAECSVCKFWALKSRTCRNILFR